MKFVQSIEYSAHQMRTLIEELLTLERLESGIEITADLVDLVKVCEEAISRTRPDAVNKAQEFIITMSETPVIVRGEFAYFRQVMVNLINNAIKYTPHRGKVSIRLERHGDRVFFDVTDTGYGISEDRQKNLFQRFYRAKEPGTEHIEGTGLGLSLVKTIIERSEGEVWFTSKVGKGSTFGFWLPLVGEDELSESEVQAITQRADEDAMFKVSATAVNRAAAKEPQEAKGNGLADDRQETPQDQRNDAART
jgi:two-component system phosphate regulon sensor histidine kinase PhoR